jgi:hypothetical protein
MFFRQSRLRLIQVGAVALSLLVTSSAFSQQRKFNTVEAAKNGWFAEQNRSANWYLAQHKKLSDAINALQPQRPGVVDAYVLSIGLARITVTVAITPKFPTPGAPPEIKGLLQLSP